MSPISGSLMAPGAAHTANTTNTQISNQAVTQLIDDLRNTDLQTRLNSFRKIQLISRALGAARTRGELIPYLGEFVDDDDEVLLILSAHLGEMLDAVGGAEYAHVLLPPLEALAASDETAVREKAVASLSKIVEQANEHTLVEHVLPLLRRLATAEWFTGRISATALLPIVYPRLPGNPATDDATRKELRSLFAHLCRKEETPMVKRAAAANLGVRDLQPQWVHCRHLVCRVTQESSLVSFSLRTLTLSSFLARRVMCLCPCVHRCLQRYWTARC